MDLIAATAADRSPARLQLGKDHVRLIREMTAQREFETKGQLQRRQDLTHFGRRLYRQQLQCYREILRACDAALTEEQAA